MAQTLPIPCKDGYHIQATYYPSTGDQGIIINAAMGVSQRFYQQFAEFMSAKGLSVLTYDYRGMERHKDNKTQCDILNWGDDQNDVIAYAKNELQLEHITLLGNSVGGQIIGMMKDTTAINKVVLITCQIGDWRLWPMPMRIKIWSLWYVFIPLLTLGKRFPSKWLGLGKGRWPSPVAQMWASWGRNKNYLFNPRFSYDLSGWYELDKPIYSIGISDDTFAPETAIQGLLSQFKSATIEHQTIQPQDLDLKSIGHFGYFNNKAQPLWQQLHTWIQK